MGALLALFIIASISLIVVRMGSTALMMTGLNWDTASFQAYSAFFGVGFTTEEAEMVVNHPVRRRIIRHLILAGNIGITTALASLIVTLVKADNFAQIATVIAIVIGGLAVLFIAARLHIIRSPIDWIIRKTLERAGVVRAMDYELLLRVRAGYLISEIEILPDSSLVGKSIAEIEPLSQGVLILSIVRGDGSFVGTPNGHEILLASSELTVYGAEAGIADLTAKASGK